MYIVLWEDRDGNSYHTTFKDKDEAITHVKMLKASGFVKVYLGVALEQ
jgi:hypothetical protein